MQLISKNFSHSISCVGIICRVQLYRRWHAVRRRRNEKGRCEQGKCSHCSTRHSFLKKRRDSVTFQDSPAEGTDAELGVLAAWQCSALRYKKQFSAENGRPSFVAIWAGQWFWTFFVSVWSICTFSLWFTARHEKRVPVEQIPVRQFQRKTGGSTTIGVPDCHVWGLS